MNNRRCKRCAAGSTPATGTQYQPTMKGKTMDNFNQSDCINSVHAKKMTTSEMQELYKVDFFAACMCWVTRKSDGVTGSLEFDHSPRFYYNFKDTLGEG